MICYKDMTFCSYKDCIHFGDKEDDPDNCPRSLTDKVLRNAEKLDLPVASFVDKPDCFEDKNKFEPESRE